MGNQLDGVLDWLERWAIRLGLSLVLLCILAECGRRVGWAWFA